MTQVVEAYNCILRLTPGSIVFQALVVQSKMNAEGNLLMDVTQYTDIDDLDRQTMDRARCCKLHYSESIICNHACTIH